MDGGWGVSDLIAYLHVVFCVLRLLLCTQLDLSNKTIVLKGKV